MTDNARIGDDTSPNRGIGSVPLATPTFVIGARLPLIEQLPSDAPGLQRTKTPKVIRSPARVLGLTHSHTA